MENLLGDPARAWAAGVFDGEGTACGYRDRRNGKRIVQLTVYQSTIPLLERFRVVVGGHGNITGPYRARLFHWTTKRMDSVQFVIGLLWPFLGQEKREQLHVAAVDSAFQGLISELRTSPAARTSRASEIAWAAGFFDGEGSIWQDAKSIRLEVPQAARPDGSPASTLVRLQAALGGAGRIRGPRILHNSWSRLPQYRWEATRFEDVQSCIAMLWPWLAEVKRGAAVGALVRPERR